jgi:hypothetical protein
MTITRTEAAKLLSDYSESKIFNVVFVKRSNGEVRSLTCRKGVTKDLKGGELAFNPLEKGLIVVYDMVKKGYRMINLESLISIRIDGKEYEIK